MCFILHKESAIVCIRKQNFGLKMERKEMKEIILSLENVLTLPNSPSPRIFINSKWQSLFGHSTLSNPICKVNYSMLISSHYNYRLFGITDTDMIARVMTSLLTHNVLTSDTPIVLFFIEDNMVSSWETHLLY